MITTRGIYINDGIRHPWRALKIAVRRHLMGLAREISVTKSDAQGEIAETDIPAPLMQFEVGEMLPWKGVRFRVGKVVGGDFPAIILVPTNLTQNRKLTVVKKFRAEMKARYVG